MPQTSSSKPLIHGDESGTDFVIEMLKGDPTYGINFDRVQWDNLNNCYVIIEYLLCDESQFLNGITPFTSHPNKYFFKDANKFISLWQIANDLKAILYLVNYSKKGTQYENEILVLKVQKVDPNDSIPVKAIEKKMTREQYSAWFRKLNMRGKR